MNARKELWIAVFSLAGIAAYLTARFAGHMAEPAANIFLYAVLGVGGLPLVAALFRKMLRRQFGSDLLAGISIVTSVVLGEYLAGAVVVLMLSGGEALEQFSMRRASRVLEALARRMPSRAHRREHGRISDIAIPDIRVGDECVVFPHEICPVDGIVLEGNGTMDESYLTGEPFMLSKTAGSAVISGAVNGESALTIRAAREAVDSRYARIIKVMEESQQMRPRMRRLADRLGAWYTPLALVIAAAAAVFSGDSHRFLSVIIIATPCPLLLAIPVAIIGAVSAGAQRGIIVKDPAVLEQTEECRVMILDKTGTLTYGKPDVTQVRCFYEFSIPEVLSFMAGVERYSKHPLAGAVLEYASREGIESPMAERISEKPGQGLTGIIRGRHIHVTGRKAWLMMHPADEKLIGPGAGLECVVAVDDRLAAVCRFHDKPRAEGKSFVGHLRPMHRFDEVCIVSGDRREEVQYLADEMGIKEIYAGQSPEEKVAIVRSKTRGAKTVYLGDGINDAPALLAATVGIAFGQHSEVTAEAAGVVIMENTLRKVDEFFHIARRMRRIALQSALGGMLLSMAGMAWAAAGHLSPVAGAVAQEIIDLAAVLNALRVSFVRGKLSDF